MEARCESLSCAAARSETLFQCACARQDRTAFAGGDYEAVNRIVKFGPFETRKVIQIPILADSFPEKNERFRVILSEPAGGIILQGENRAESIYINDAQDDPANDDFAAAIPLPAPNGKLRANNRGASREPLEPFHLRPRNRSVWYAYRAPADGFARFQTRNKSFSTLLSVYTGAGLGALNREQNRDDSDIFDDSDDFDETFRTSRIRVRKGETYYVAVDDSDDSDDNDDSSDPEDSDDSNDGHGGGGRAFLLKWRTVLPGRLQFSVPSFTTRENSRSAAITVKRSGGASNRVSVRYSTRAGSAKAGDDYTEVRGTLVFERGQKRRTFLIPIENDSIFERPETVNLFLAAPGGGAGLGLSQAQLTISSDDPFTPGSGNYTALVELEESFSNRFTGRLTLQTSANGGLTGTLKLGGVTYPIRGSFEDTHAVIMIKRGSQPPLRLELDLTSDGALLTGTLASGNAMAVVRGERNGFNAKRNPAPQAGKYTVLLPGNDLEPSNGFPKGDGWATMRVRTSGIATIVGELADGTKLSTSMTLARSGEAPLYAALYNRKGSLSGTVQFASIPGVSDASGILHWFKASRAPGSELYPEGFSIDLPLVASRYAFQQGQRILGSLESTEGAAVVNLGEGNLLLDLSQTIVINRRSQVELPSGSAISLRLEFDKEDGTFRGSFLKPGTDKRIPFHGAVLQSAGRAGGFFLGRTESGFVRIAPATPAQ